MRSTIAKSLAAAASAVLSLALLAGCGGDSDDESTDTTAAEQPATGGDESADQIAELGRVVAIGEEFLLADLLALGIEPVASTATVSDIGFQGIDQHDTSEITPLPATEPNFERLASFEPDTIITSTFITENLGIDELDQMADVIAVPHSISHAEQVTWLGEELGLEDEAEALVDEWETARETALTALGSDDCHVSVATIYAGSVPAAWIDEPNPVAVILNEAGCELSPGRDDYDADTTGRVYLSEEQLGLLEGDVLILLQTDTVDGELDSLSEMEADPLWSTLPAVEAGRVITMDRLGYPGIEGQIRLIDELADAMADAEG